jgi:hypothetical protein
MKGATSSNVAPAPENHNMKGYVGDGDKAPLDSQLSFLFFYPLISEKELPVATE